MKYKLVVITVVLFSCLSCLETKRPDRRANLTISAPVQQRDTTVQIEGKVISLFGNEFPPLGFSSGYIRNTQQLITSFRQDYENHPDSLEVLMNYARGLDVIGNFRVANDVYRQGLKIYRNSPEIYQYKGLNEIVQRNFRQAIKDLRMAVLLNRGQQNEPDFYQNPRFSAGSRQFYCWYYLGLAYYFNRNYDSAISSFKKCLQVEEGDDLIVMPYYWLYIIYQEIGNPEVAQTFLEDVDTKMSIDKSKDYYRGLLLFKGLFRPSRLLEYSLDKQKQINSPVQIYALAIWNRLNGSNDEARQLINRSIDSERWNDLGFIAGEVDSYYYVNNLN